jgi:hypothetical protein
LIGGQPRQQAALLTLGATRAGVSPWTSTRWNEDCSTTLALLHPRRDWTPGGTGFVIVTTGAGFPGTLKLCDTASRGRYVDAGGQQPQWINDTGGDTLHLVVVDKAVFVSGHQRWLDNILGRDTKGPGTDEATAWNPSTSTEGGIGGLDLYITSRGLWVGHFERLLGTGPTGREPHEGLGLLPYWAPARGRATAGLGHRRPSSSRTHPDLGLRRTLCETAGHGRSLTGGTGSGPTVSTSLGDVDTVPLTAGAS